jgi:putative endonuclease
MMASKRYGTIYVGVTSDLPKRVWEHKNGITPGFTSRYKVHDLVWYEWHDRIEWERSSASTT